MIKVLNLYAGIGGNRKLWEDVEVTAVEINPDIAKIYGDFFPSDNVVVGDAHQYLLDHFKDFDFIWSSPPCQTHSNTNMFLNAQGVRRYPDMGLYQEIIYLENFFKGKYAVENVIPYYEPLRPGQKAGRHLFWCNFIISDKKKNKKLTVTNCKAATRRSSKDHLNSLKKEYGIDCDNIKFLSNCVDPKLGKHIFDCAYSKKQHKLGEDLK